MAIYKIEIEEILQNIIEVEADSLEKALAITQEKYANDEIELDAFDLKETNFREVK